MSRACAALSDLDFSSDDSSSSEKDEKVKRKPDDFTDLCLMGKSSRHISDSNSNVSDDLSPESLSLRVIELENALCNQGKLLCKVFCENKKMNLELESVFLKLLLFDPRMMIRVQSQVITALWSWLTMRICGSCILMLIGCLMVPDWNSESSKLIPDYLVLAPLVPCLDLIWRLWSLRLKILSTNLIILLTTVFYPLRVMRVAHSRVSFSMLPKRTLSFNRRLPIWLHAFRKLLWARKWSRTIWAGLRRVQPNPHTNWVLVFRGVKIRVRRVLPNTFLAPPTTKRKQQSNPPKLITHQTQSLPSTLREKWGKKPPSRERKLLCAYFVAVPVTWMSFTFGTRGLRGDALIMPETHIVMSFLIFHLTLSLTLCLALLLVLCFSSLMDITITHMVLVHERNALSLDAFVTAHVLIMVIVSRVGLFFCWSVSHSLWAETLGQSTFSPS
jgi:hypothetical protein